MKFESLAPRAAVGAIVAHTARIGGVSLKKGALVTPEAAEALAAAGLESLVVARLEADDVGEDEAAAALAAAVAGEGIRIERAFTGRANLFAARAGVLRADVARVDALNAVDEAITLATLPAMKPVVEGEMIATVKIIPFAAPRALVERAIAAGAGALAVAGYRPMRVIAISTLAPGLKPSVIDKTMRVLVERLAPTGAKLVGERRVAHAPQALAQAIAAAREEADLIIVFGASAITDRRDVIPAALEAAGGEVAHFGMPVDPGNLLMIGAIGGKPVIGAPGCARSPRENGFDWVLHRLIAGVPVGAADIRGMGVGGLLMEIVSRPQPREGGDSHEDDDDRAP
ncbi:MAG: molybdopterin-binding protein [Methylobacteriaceae bacterium]|nr:molybdopterin-binding protein [Methylobacteriaceae bacterium]